MSRRRQVIVAGALAIAALGGAVGVALGARPALNRVMRAAVPEIERAAGRFLGGQVRIARIEPRLDWLRPEFVFDEVHAGEALEAERLEIQIDLWESLRAWDIRFGQLKVSGLSVRIEEAEGGRWKLMGLAPATDGASQGRLALPPWLSSSVRVIGSDLRAEVRRPGKQKTSRAETRRFEARAEMSSLGELVLRFGAEQATVDWPSQWRRPWTLEYLKAELSVSSEWTWTWRDALAQAPGLEVRGRGSFKAADGTIRLEIDADRLELPKLKGWIPNTALPEAVRGWLDTAFVAGSSKRGSLRLSGQVSGGASGKERFRTEVDVDFEGVELSYLDEWPTVSGASGNFWLKGNEAGFRLGQARAGKFHLPRSQGVFAGLSGEAPMLKLELDVSGAGTELAAFLREGPLRKSLRSLPDSIEPREAFESSLRLEVPLEEGDVSGVVEVRRAALIARLAGMEGPFEQVRGKIGFSPGKVELSSFEADLDGERWAFSGTRIEQAGKPPMLNLDFGRFALSTERAAKKIRELGFEGKITGHLIGKAKVQVHEEAQSRWSVEGESDLAGLRLQAPPPVGKESGAKTAWSWKLSGQGERTSELALRLVAEGLVLGYSGKGARDRLTLQGKVRALDVDAWREWYSDWKPQAAQAREAGEGESRETDLEIDLKASVASAGKLELHEAELKLTREGKAVSARLRSKEAAGTVIFSLPLPQSTLVADFQHLLFPKREEPEASGPEDEPEIPPTPEPGWDLSQWPSIQFRCARTQWDGRDWGETRGRVRQAGDRLVLEEFAARAPELELTLERGEARYRGGAVKTSLEGYALLKDLEKRWGPSTKEKSVRLQQGRVEFHGAWPGGPEQFEWARFDGNISGYVRQGRFAGIRSFAQTLFNLLSLEFGDTRKGQLKFYKGSFDSKIMGGTWHLRHARALFGSVYVRASGTAALNPSCRFRDMKARVVPSVEDIPDPSMPLDPAWEEPRHLLATTRSIEGRCKDPD